MNSRISVTALKMSCFQYFNRFYETLLAIRQMNISITRTRSASIASGNFYEDPQHKFEGGIWNNNIRNYFHELVAR